MQNKICRKCNKSEWNQRSNGQFYCKNCNNDRATRWQMSKYGKEYKIKYRASKDEQKEYRLDNKYIHRWYQYKSWDKKHGFSNTIDKIEAIKLLSQSCFYCTKNDSNGLDRKDNSLGHDTCNVVPCCEVCNFLLCDIPFAAKEVLIFSLTEINKKQLLSNWNIPIKRK